MIDTHCHLQFKAFENDYDPVIQNAFSEGVTTIINTGTQLSSSQKAIEFAQKYENLYAIVGIHPHHADKIQSDPYIRERTEGAPVHNNQVTRDKDYWLKELEKLAKQPKVLAIGEIGLDYYSYQSNGIVDPKLQKEIFIAQIELAYRVKLPLQIHNRQAGNDVIALLKQNKSKLLNNPGVFHCFAGSKEILTDALDLGFSIGFDGNSTYNGLAPGETTALPDLIKATPLDRIVIETDAPYLTPVPFRGTRNEPKYIPYTFRFVAQCKGTSFEKLVEHTDKNVYTMFKRITRN